MTDRLSSRQGFSLIEILVALAILSLVASMMLGFFDSERAELDKTLATLERAISLSESEAIFQNSFTRLNFKLHDDSSLLYDGDSVTLETPQEYTIERANTKNLTIDPDLLSSTEEEDEEEIKEYNREYSVLPEVEDGKIILANNVRIFGVGSALLKKLITENVAALYTFPSGEKDAAIIILGTSSELATITVEPFSAYKDRRYYDIRGKNLEQIREMVEGIYEEWLK